LSFNGYIDDIDDIIDTITVLVMQHPPTKIQKYAKLQKLTLLTWRCGFWH